MTDTGRTPTEELMLEVLIARTRLGHTLWTFDSNRASRQAAKKLEARGLIGIKGGRVEKTFMAWLTDDGISKHMKNQYVPPILGGPK